MKKFNLKKFKLWIGFAGLLILWLVVFIIHTAFEKTKYKTDGEWIKVRKGTVVYSRI